jgi:hypothetical protein
MTVIEIQDAFLKAGWQWREQVWQDGDAAIGLTQSKDPCVLLYDRPKDYLGWGRFPRKSCWTQAYNFILDRPLDAEVTLQNEIAAEQLREKFRERGVYCKVEGSTVHFNSAYLQWVSRTI